MHEASNSGTPADKGERLSKRVAALQACSRAEAERLIEGGWVQVDGQRVEDPAQRVHGQAITVDPLARPDELSPVTLIWHKPQGQALAENQAIDGLLKAEAPLRSWRLRHLRCLSALPAACSGLVVFAQDVRGQQRLLETIPLIEQEWMLDVEGPCQAETLKALEAAIELLRLGRSVPSLRLSRNSDKGGITRLRLAIKSCNIQALPGWVASAGLQVRSLHRLRLGRMSLGPLVSGDWRVLNPHERF